MQFPHMAWLGAVMNSHSPEALLAYVGAEVSIVTSALPTHHPNRVTLHPAHDLGIAVKFSEERIHRPVGQ